MENTSENVTQKVTSVLKVLKSMPRIYRVITIIAVFVAIVALCLGLTSCGVTRAVVQNKATGTSTEIKITTSNPTSVNASPNVSIPLNYGKKNDTAQGY